MKLYEHPSVIIAAIKFGACNCFHTEHFGAFNQSWLSHSSFQRHKKTPQHSASLFGVLQNWCHKREKLELQDKGKSQFFIKKKQHISFFQKTTNYTISFLYTASKNYVEKIDMVYNAQHILYIVFYFSLLYVIIQIQLYLISIQIIHLFRRCYRHGIQRNITL